jgi:hypothetical protein
MRRIPRHRAHSVTVQLTLALRDRSRSATRQRSVRDACAGPGMRHAGGGGRGAAAAWERGVSRARSHALLSLSALLCAASLLVAAADGVARVCCRRGAFRTRLICTRTR